MELFEAFGAASILRRFFDDVIMINHPLMSAKSALIRAARPIAISRPQWYDRRRWAQVSARLSGSLPDLDRLTVDATKDLASGDADAGFEVLGTPYSLLKVSLSASQPFYTRRGTLVGVSGKVDNVVSNLSLLEPITRSVLGIPFFYQKVTSASPVTALVSSKSNYTSFATIHLDGTLDWMIAQRNALLCWTGQTLSLTPRMNTRLSLSQWGSTQVTGRGLLGVVGKGQIYEIDIAPGEHYVVHPSNVVAYSMNQVAPLPYRFKSSVLRLQIPGLNRFQGWAQNIKFFRNMQETSTWKFATRVLFTVRSWSRRTIWGDRLFLQFEGPSTILLQTRCSRVSDVLTGRELSETVDSEPGVISKVTSLVDVPPKAATPVIEKTPALPTKVSYASIGDDGQVKFENNKP